MNGRELFCGLTRVSYRYIDEAENGILAASPKGAKNHSRLRRPLLVAALAALLLLLVGCAVAYSSGWFQRVFSVRSDAPLSNQQIQYLESNEQPVRQTQGNQEWSVELKSTISDGTAAYLVFQVTAPQETNLEQYLNPPSTEAKHLMPGNYSVGKNAAYSMAIASIGNVDRERNYMYIDNGDWMPDNDGEANTVLY